MRKRIACAPGQVTDQKFAAERNISQLLRLIVLPVFSFSATIDVLHYRARHRRLCPAASRIEIQLIARFFVGELVENTPQVPQRGIIRTKLEIRIETDTLTLNIVVIKPNMLRCKDA